MKHSDFKIGESFFLNDIEWKCTDKGTRVIVAVKLRDLDKGEVLKGPPYSICEYTLDEYDILGCNKEKVSDETSVTEDIHTL